MVDPNERIRAELQKVRKLRKPNVKVLARWLRVGAARMRWTGGWSMRMNPIPNRLDNIATLLLMQHAALERSDALLVDLSQQLRDFIAKIGKLESDLQDMRIDNESLRGIIRGLRKQLDQKDAPPL